MSRSLVKYIRASRDQQPSLHWGRLQDDGLPFRGNPPVYTQEEADEYLVRTADAKNGTFDLADPEQNVRYLEVLDRCCNGWYSCLFVQRMITPEKQLIYIEWLENYVEDGGPARDLQHPTAVVPHRGPVAADQTGR